MIKKTTWLLLVVVLVVFSGCSLFASTDPVNPAATELVIVTVPKGAGANAIAKVLKEKNLIKSELGFKELAKQKGVQSSMKAGDYELSAAMSAEEIITKLSNGEVYVEKVKIVIPEGFEVKQIEARLIEAGLVTKEGFEDALENGEFDYEFLKDIPNGKYRLEGFLYPATYQIPVGSTETEIIQMMLIAFDKHFKAEYYEQVKTMNLSVLEVITLASIVEREAKLDEERPTVASVFFNRIEKRKLLESCATVQYALGERKERLLYKDLEIDSPYNTYKYLGLPPGPIASPGIKSIDAVLNPAQTEYLYFRTSAKKDGSHDFSKTFEEHQNSGEGTANQ